MDLASVPEIGPPFAQKLQQAGVENAEALAGWADLAALAASTGIGEERLESFRDAARGKLERTLAEAGVADPADLADADIAALMGQTGLSRDYLERYQTAARSHVKRTLEAAGYKDAASIAAIGDLEDAVMKTGIAAKHLAHYRDEARTELADRAGWRVVLLESAPVARVEVAGATHHAVPLVTAGPAEEDDTVLARAGGDAVLLRPAFDVVPVLIGGATHREVPLFKERRKPDGELEEVRVRIAEIREIEEPKKKGGLGRLFRRGG